MRLGTGHTTGDCCGTGTLSQTRCADQRWRPVATSWPTGHIDPRQDRHAHRRSPDHLDWTGDEQTLAWAIAAEANNKHPVAEAIRRTADSHNDLRTRYANHVVSDVTSHLGCGVSATVDGHKIVVGNRHLQIASGCELDDKLESRIEEIVAAGQSPLLVSVDGRIAGIAALGDELRSEARQVMDRLTRRGWQIHILSGDHPRIVAQVPRAWTFTRQLPWGVTPEGKLSFVQSCLKSGGPVVMVGDGVNDAAALAAADVGIAVRGGAEASMQAADIYLAMDLSLVSKRS